MICSECHKKIKPKIGELWHNDINYRVKILDIGDNEVWLLYLDNNNRCSWNIDAFLKQYHYVELVEN